MTTREEIIDLVRKCAEPDGDFGIDNAIAFFHATQRQAYERAAGICERLATNGICHTNYPEEAFAGDCATEIRALIEGNEK